jgi:flagellar basal-body rod protein FlgB
MSGLGAITGASGMMNDPIARALGAAIDGLDARQQAISANLANVETPGYLARTVSFEDSLRSAIGGGDPSNMQITVGRSVAATRVNGNNVNVDSEMMLASENVLAQRLMVQSLNSKYAVLRTAITGM